MLKKEYNPEYFGAPKLNIRKYQHEKGIWNIRNKKNIKKATRKNSRVKLKVQGIWMTEPSIISQDRNTSRRLNSHGKPSLANF